MKSWQTLALAALASWGGAVGASDMAPPAPMAVPSVFGGSWGGHGHGGYPDGSCHAKGCGKRGCCQKLKAWACYRPLERAKCCEYNRCMPCTPRLYLFFPPCREGCGAGCKGGCNGLGERCGFCASGARMFDLQTAHGFGLVNGPGQMK
jgi:hypothetical protein